jgi:hypothetical protein
LSKDFPAGNYFCFIVFSGWHLIRQHFGDDNILGKVSKTIHLQIIVGCYSLY